MDGGRLGIIEAMACIDKELLNPATPPPPPTPPWMMAPVEYELIPDDKIFAVAVIVLMG